MPIEIIRTIDEIRELSRKVSVDGKKVALVPTMGGLHQGHLSLVQKASEIADVVVVSLFVNPAQFDNPADLENYPGTELEDLAALEKTNAHVLFAPSVEEMYPANFATNVSVSAGSKILCDAHRPGHFSGVATIVSKLFLQVEPDFACFGEKDFQQLFIVRKMTRDLDIPVQIIPCETVRDERGLALSSRNKRISQEHIETAPKLHLSMLKAAQIIREGSSPDETCQNNKSDLEKLSPFKIEYFEYRDGETLVMLENYHPRGRIFAAAWLGDVRLIDNVAV
ncbi:MAG: pantoate--beta-alanine ligase [Pseudomonadota bacterium]